MIFNIFFLEPICRVLNKYAKLEIANGNSMFKSVHAENKDFCRFLFMLHDYQCYINIF